MPVQTLIIYVVVQLTDFTVDCFLMDIRGLLLAEIAERCILSQYVSGTSRNASQETESHWLPPSDLAQISKLAAPPTLLVKHSYRF